MNLHSMKMRVFAGRMFSGVDFTEVGVGQSRLLARNILFSRSDSHGLSSSGFSCGLWRRECLFREHARVVLVPFGNPGGHDVGLRRY